MERDLSGQVTACPRCHEDISLQWSNEFGAKLKLCKKCGMVAFEQVADMRTFMKEAYNDGATDIEEMLDMVGNEIRKRFGWLDFDTRVTLTNLLIDQNFDKVKFDAKADAQEAGNE